MSELAVKMDTEMKKSLKFTSTCLIILLGLVMRTGNLHAQDIQFSQFYNVPLYQNPAFAGSAHSDRIIIHQRLQWPKLDAKYTTSLLSYDTYFADYHSGVGVMVFKDNQAGGTVNTLNVSGIYSYELRISSGYFIRAGLQATYGSINLNTNNLIFPSQYSDYGLNGTTTDMGTLSKKYVDLSSGAVFYGGNLWVGFTANHMNTPNQSVTGGMSRLPAKFAVTGGYKIRLRETKITDYYQNQKEISITPTFHYKTQGTSDQLDLGTYLIYEGIVLGGWYRGLPIKNYNKNLPNNESMVAQVGFRHKFFQITYSYDWTISKLHSAKTGGSHEFNITLLPGKRYKKKKPMKRLPCPTF